MSENTEYIAVKLPSKVYDRIEKAVVALYKQLKITTFPINPFTIASQLGFIVRKYSSLPRYVQIELKTREKEGLSHYDPDIGAFIIYYDDSVSYYRARFTLMHEIGHIILGHREESDLARKMADYFAAYALAPSPLMGYYECEDYMDVAMKFDVSQECADICFQRFSNWSCYSGKMKMYESELIGLFE